MFAATISARTWRKPNRMRLGPASCVVISCRRRMPRMFAGFLATTSTSVSCSTSIRTILGERRSTSGLPDCRLTSGLRSADQSRHNQRCGAGSLRHERRHQLAERHASGILEPDSQHRLVPHGNHRPMRQHVVWLPLAKAPRRGKACRGLPIVVAVAFLLIADIDSPRHGLIRISPENLQSLAKSLGR
jgi:hypothetical protein